MKIYSIFKSYFGLTRVSRLFSCCFKAGRCELLSVAFSVALRFKCYQDALPSTSSTARKYFKFKSKYPSSSKLAFSSFIITYFDENDTVAFLVVLFLVCLAYLSKFPLVHCMLVGKFKSRACSFIVKKGRIR